MSERLWYGASYGVVNSASWEWGLHFRQMSTVVADPVATWTIGLNIFYDDPAGGGFPYHQFQRNGQMSIEGRIYEIDPVTERKLSVSTMDGAGGGSAAGGNCPPACAPLVMLEPLDGVPRVRGRLYLPPMSTAFLAGGDLDTTTAGRMARQVQRVADFMASQGYQLVIRSRRTHTSHPARVRGCSNQLAYLMTRTHDAEPIYRLA